MMPQHLKGNIEGLTHTITFTNIMDLCIFLYECDFKLYASQEIPVHNKCGLNDY